MPAAVRLGNLLPSGVFSGGTLSSFKGAVNLCLYTEGFFFIFVYVFSFFIFVSVFFCCSIDSGAVLMYRCIPFPSSMGQVFLITIIIIITRFTNTSVD